MKIPRIDMTSVAALPNGEGCINQIGLRADPAVPDGGAPNGNSAPVMVQFNKCDIAAGTGNNTGDARVPAPESLVGLPTAILSWQVE